MQQLSPVVSRLYAALLGCMLCSSCSVRHRLYFPNRINSPGLSVAQEARFSAAIKPHNSEHSLFPGNLSLSIDGAFAPVNHFGIIASYRGVNGKKLRDEEYAYAGSWQEEKDSAVQAIYTGSRWEGGAGYFTAFGRVGRAELYAGYGAGTLNREATQSRSYNDFTARYHRFFIQPAGGVGTRKFSGMAGFRLMVQQVTAFKSAGNPQLPYTIYDGDGPRGITGQPAGLLEPFIQAEPGGRVLKASFQFSTGVWLFGPRINADIPWHFSMGISVRLKPALWRRWQQ